MDSNDPSHHTPYEPWNYIMDFGPHKGQRLRSVPQDYLRWHWQRRRQTVLNRPQFVAALRSLRDLTRAKGKAPIRDTSAIPSLISFRGSTQEFEPATDRSPFSSPADSSPASSSSTSSIPTPSPPRSDVSASSAFQHVASWLDMNRPAGERRSPVERAAASPVRTNTSLAFLQTPVQSQSIGFRTAQAPRKANRHYHVDLSSQMPSSPLPEFDEVAIDPDLPVVSREDTIIPPSSPPTWHGDDEVACSGNPLDNQPQHSHAFRTVRSSQRPGMQPSHNKRAHSPVRSDDQPRKVSRNSENKLLDELREVRRLITDYQHETREELSARGRSIQDTQQNLSDVLRSGVDRLWEGQQNLSDTFHCGINFLQDGQHSLSERFHRGILSVHDGHENLRNGQKDLSKDIHRGISVLQDVQQNARNEQQSLHDETVKSQRFLQGEVRHLGDALQQLSEDACDGIGSVHRHLKGHTENREEERKSLCDQVISGVVQAIQDDHSRQGDLQARQTGQQDDTSREAAMVELAQKLAAIQNAQERLSDLPGLVTQVQTWQNEQQNTILDRLNAIDQSARAASTVINELGHERSVMIQSQRDRMDQTFVESEERRHAADERTFQNNLELHQVNSQAHLDRLQRQLDNANSRVVGSRARTQQAENRVEQLSQEIRARDQRLNMQETHAELLQRQLEQEMESRSNSLALYEANARYPDIADQAMRVNDRRIRELERELRQSESSRLRIIALASDLAPSSSRGRSAHSLPFGTSFEALVQEQRAHDETRRAKHTAELRNMQDLQRTDSLERTLSQLEEECTSSIGRDGGSEGELAGANDKRPFYARLLDIIRGHDAGERGITDDSDGPESGVGSYHSEGEGE